MSEIDLERLLSEPIHAFDFQFMIGDVEEFLDFSEGNIEWQFRRELQSIQRRAEAEDFAPEYKEHLESNAEHRFKVSLPLRVRYGALIALSTSVEWSVLLLVDRLKEGLRQKPTSLNDTVHALTELMDRTGLQRKEVLLDYEALVQVRNCITHSAGIEKNYKYRKKLPVALDRLSGFSLGNWHFFGKHICIEKAALNPYIEAMSKLVVELHKAAHEKGLLRDDT